MCGPKLLAEVFALKALFFRLINGSRSHEGMTMGGPYKYSEIGLPIGHAYPESHFQSAIGVIVVRTRSPDL